MRIIGSEGDAPVIFETSGGAVKARTGLESAICFEISRVVLRGLVVVMMAPREMTERHTTGKYMELGERRRMTSPLLIPMVEREELTASTARHSCW